MTTSRINWPTALTRGARYVPLITVAGVPVLLTPAGVHPTAAAFTGDPDPAWWLNASSGSLAQSLPGAVTFDPVKDWLDPSQVFEVYTEARALDGDTHVDPFTFTVYDKDSAATALLSIQQARVSQPLASEIGPTDTSIPLASMSGIPSSGIACIGRESLIYDSTGGGALLITGAPSGRGKFGSTASRHTVPPTHPPLVTAAGPRFWQSRRAVVWIAALSADGLTITDPTPLFIGTVGAGVQLVSGGMRWSIPLDPISEAYSRKWTPRTVDLFGIAHFYPDFTQPLQVGWLSDTYLDSQNDSINNLGWHSDWSTFFNDFARRAAVTEGTALRVSDSSNRIQLIFTGGSSNQLATIVAAWATPPYRQDYINTNGTIVLAQPPPDTCVHLDGRVRLGRTGDIDQIPTTLAWTVTEPSAGSAYLALACKTDHTEKLVARILSRSSSPPELVVRAQFAPNAARDVERSEARQQACVITKRTSASLAVIASGETALGALKVLADALSEVCGLDLPDDSIDWAGLAREFGRYPFPLVERREYRIDKGDTLLDLLVQECRVRGMAMAIRYGRISAYRPASFAATEPVRARITKADVLLDSEGNLASWDVIDNTQPLASTVSFELPDGTIYSWVDTTFQGEFGDGAEVKITALKHLPPDITVPALATNLQSVAWQILGPLAEPSRIVRLPLPPTFLHLQAGDLVTLTHDMVPSWTGARGLDEVTCQVTEVRSQTWGGKARAVLGFRLQSQELAGYAPEALVAAGGLDHASHVVTLDVTSGFGASCFARNVDVDGNAASDPTDGFVVGQKVLLSEIDTESPITDEAFTITAVDVIGHTITLSGFPSLAMAALAAAAYKVVIRFDDWATVTVGQQAYAFIADHTSGELGSGDPAKRWAA